MIFYSLHRNPQTPQAQPDLHQPSLGDSHVVNFAREYINLVLFLIHFIFKCNIISPASIIKLRPLFF